MALGVREVRSQLLRNPAGKRTVDVPGDESVFLRFRKAGEEYPARMRQILRGVYIQPEAVADIHSLNPPAPGQPSNPTGQGAVPSSAGLFQGFKQSRVAQEETRIRSIEPGDFFADVGNGIALHPHLGCVTQIEDPVGITIHCEQAGARFLCGLPQVAKDVGIEKMIAHDHEERTG